MRNGTDRLRVDRIGLRESAGRRHTDCGNEFASLHRWSSPSSCTAVLKRRPGRLNVTALSGASEEAGESLIGPNPPEKVTGQSTAALPRRFRRH
jgi:hypothetical protein